MFLHIVEMGVEITPMMHLWNEAHNAPVGNIFQNAPVDVISSRFIKIKWNIAAHVFSSTCVCIPLPYLNNLL